MCLVRLWRVKKTLIEMLIQRARTYIYTTAMPPLLACALSKAVEVIAAGAPLRQQLAENIIQLKQILKKSLSEGWQLLPSLTAIQPLVVGENRTATALAEQLATRGVLVPAIRPPTVPQGTARLRISLSAAHSEADVRVLTDAAY